MRLSLVVALLAWPLAARAHGAAFGETGHAPIWIAQGVFVVAWCSYALGAIRRRPTPQGRLAFHAAMLIGGIALFGPFDDLAGASTAWHMAQHMLLIVVVAPLLVAARPMAQWRACFGARSDPLWRGATRLSRHVGACAVLHAAAIWGWHLPGPYMAAVMHTGLHVLEHASFLLTGVWFWWAVLRAGRGGRLAAAMALLFTLMHTGFLGALLTFAPEPLYWRESRELFDQQLAGLVMWVPGGAAYVAGIVWVVARLLAGGPAHATAPRAAQAAR